MLTLACDPGNFAVAGVGGSAETNVRSVPCVVMVNSERLFCTICVSVSLVGHRSCSGACLLPMSHMQASYFSAADAARMGKDSIAICLTI